MRRRPLRLARLITMLLASGITLLIAAILLSTLPASATERKESTKTNPGPMSWTSAAMRPSTASRSPAAAASPRLMKRTSRPTRASSKKSNCCW